MPCREIPIVALADPKKLKITQYTWALFFSKKKKKVTEVILNKIERFHKLHHFVSVLSTILKGRTSTSRSNCKREGCITACLVVWNRLISYTCTHR